MTLSPLPILMIEAPVRAALLEDLGRAGDLTTDAIVPPRSRQRRRWWRAKPVSSRASMRRRLRSAWSIPPIQVRIERPDGSRVKPGDRIATIAGPARGMLTAERVALNFLGHLSGVASATATLVEAVRGHKARICCTRKTMPGLRALQKYAVRAGGGVNHRFGLDDAVLIKDNHVAAAGGVGAAIRAARAGVGHLVKIEVEIDRLDQLDEALAEKADAVLLDNMGPETLAEAVRRIGGPRHRRGVGSHHAGDGARHCRERRRSHLGGLADAQRPGARYRARLAACFDRGRTIGGVRMPIFSPWRRQP